MLEERFGVLINGKSLSRSVNSASTTVMNEQSDQNNVVEEGDSISCSVNKPMTLEGDHETISVSKNKYLVMVISATMKSYEKCPYIIIGTVHVPKVQNEDSFTARRAQSTMFL